MKLKYIAFTLALFFLAGCLVPEQPIIPVKGATNKDWNSQTFWYEPWGSSGTHKGIDIFAAANTPVVAPTPMLLLYKGDFLKGGKVVVGLGPKWQMHYFAHLGLSLFPRPWRIDTSTQGYKKAFYLNPIEYLEAK